MQRTPMREQDNSAIRGISNEKGTTGVREGKPSKRFESYDQCRSHSFPN